MAEVRYVLLVAACFVAGCSFDTSGVEGTLDSAIAGTDTRPADVEAPEDEDGPTVDSPVGLEGGSDGPSPDSPVHDGPSPDSPFPDGPPPDGPSDGPLPDGPSPDLVGFDAQPPPWWNTSWVRRRKLVFKNNAATQHLIDFPVMVHLTSGRVDYSKTKAGGADLRFVDADDATLLAHEIELWSASGDSYLWVRVPQIDKGSNTDYIWLYYDNLNAQAGQQPSAVWDQGYKIVYHLHDDLEDSTQNKNNGSNKGSTNAGGIVGDGQAFNGTDQYIDTSYTVNLSKWTVSAWVRSPAVPNQWSMNCVVTRQENYQICWDHPSSVHRGAVSYKRGGTSTFWPAASFGQLNASTWYFLVGTYDGASLRAYKNGVEVNVDTQSTFSAPNPSSHTLKIGRHAVDSGGSNHFEGQVDEVRISDKPRSGDWIAAQYSSMNDTFVVHSSTDETVP
jgi:hypothetical protein